MLRSVTIPRFWELYDKLPRDVQLRAEKSYKLFSSNPAHPSLQLKQVGGFWCVRITDAYRALAVREGNEFVWVWIGSHDEYERTIR